MRRAIVAAVGLIGLVSVAGFSAYALAAPKAPTKRAFTETTTGAEISAKGTSVESVYKVNNSLDGAGAAIQDASVTGTTFPLSGTDAITTYFANGVLKTKDTFKLSALNAAGIGTVTGSGRCVGGTGVYKTQKCTYTFTGTFNSKTTVAKVKATGTVTL